MNIYKTHRWEQLRLRVLRRDEYKDQIAARYGRNDPADTVHHVFPREEYPEYQWSPWNLISVSNKTHNALHDRITGALTSDGINLLIRTARKNGIEIPEKYR